MTDGRHVAAPPRASRPMRLSPRPPRPGGSDRSRRPARHPVRPLRTAITSAMTATAVSAGVRAPMSSPIGDRSRSRSGVPSACSAAVRRSCVDREPIAPTYPAPRRSARSIHSASNRSSCASTTTAVDASIGRSASTRVGQPTMRSSRREPFVRQEHRPRVHDGDGVPEDGCGVRHGDRGLDGADHDAARSDVGVLDEDAAAAPVRCLDDGPERRAGRPGVERERERRRGAGRRATQRLDDVVVVRDHPADQDLDTATATQGGRPHRIGVVRVVVEAEALEHGLAGDEDLGRGVEQRPLDAPARDRADDLSARQDGHRRPDAARRAALHRHGRRDDDGLARVEDGQEARCQFEHHAPPTVVAWCSAPRASAQTRSRVIGSRYGRTPRASRTAFAIAGATGLYGASLIDFAPGGRAGRASRRTAPRCGARPRSSGPGTTGTRPW